MLARVVSVSRLRCRDAASLAAVQARDRRSRRPPPAARDRRSAPRGRLSPGSRARKRVRARSRRRCTRSAADGRQLEARARRDAEARQRQHRLGLLPAREVEVLVGADQEHRVVPRSLAQHVHGPGVVVEHDLAVGERRPRELEPRLRPGSGRPCAPGRRRRPRPRLSARARARAASASATWPTCGGSNAPPSRPITRSPASRRRPRPRCRLRAPAARSAASSSSGGGGRPVDAEAAVGAEDPERRGARGCGR